jgi:predicted metalloprotease with PDZ domain
VVPHLGVAAQESDAGITFAAVLRDGPAWQAGLTGGDRLIAIDGQTVARGQLDTALRAKAIGDEAAVTVTRGPRLLTLPVRLAAKPPPRSLVAVEQPTDAQRHAFRRWTGHELDAL